MPQESLPATFMRGGTSKGLFVRESDLPPPGPERDALILELLGSPDPMQIDGMGGTYSSTSKVMAISPSTEPGCDVDYLFAQGAIVRPVVDYRGNCGNLTSAVGVYAIDEGMVADVTEPVTTVMLFNKNTGRRVRARIPVENGHAAVDGDHRIAGVPRPGARIETEFLDPAGSVFGALFPTGRAQEVIETSRDRVEVSIVDVSSPVVFLRASAVGLRGDELPADVNARPDLLDRLEEIRAVCAARLGLVDDPARAADVSPSLPRVGIVSPQMSFRTVMGAELEAADMDLCVRAMSVQQMHHAYPMTVQMCTAAAARLPGTVVHDIAARPAAPDVRLGHPKGVTVAMADIDTSGEAPRVVSVSITRTARRLMRGEVFHRTPRVAARAVAPGDATGSPAPDAAPAAPGTDDREQTEAL